MITLPNSWRQSPKGYDKNSSTMMQCYKLIVLGNGGVGKSAITLRFVQDIFEENYVPTIEDAYRNIKDIDGRPIRLEIIDTAGTEQFRAMRDIYMKDGDGYILVYDITDEVSFEEIKQLQVKIIRTREELSETETAIIVVGNKADLESSRSVPKTSGQAFAIANGCEFIESSAKSDLNIDAIFTNLVREIKRLSAKNKVANEQGCKCAIMWPSFDENKIGYKQRKSSTTLRYMD